MVDRVILESRHKFVYYDDESKDQILDMVSRYLAKIDYEDPIAVYISDVGLPKIDNKLGLDIYRINFFHRSYYELLIFESIIDTLIHTLDIDYLNSIFKRLYELCSLSNGRKITDVVELRDILEKCKNTYKQEYVNYMESGNLGDFYSNLDIPFVIIDSIILCIKKSIGLKKYFSLLLDIDVDISIYNQMAICDYIASRCNGYLSMNVLLNNSEWNCYYDTNGQFIQDVHDYTEIDLRKKNMKIKSRHN